MSETSISTKWNGYCPESLLLGKLVRMRVNQQDFFESEETGLQISLIPNLLAVILNVRGKGRFRDTKTFGDKVEQGEMLSPQNTDRAPFSNPPVIFMDSNEIAKYIAGIKHSV